MRRSRPLYARALGPLTVLATLLLGLSAMADWTYHPWGSWAAAPPEPSGHGYTTSSKSCPVDPGFPTASASVRMYNDSWGSDDSHNAWSEASAVYALITAGYCPSMQLRIQCKNSSGFRNTQTFDWEAVTHHIWQGDAYYCPAPYPIQHRSKCRTANVTL